MRNTSKVFTFLAFAFFIFGFCLSFFPKYEFISTIANTIAFLSICYSVLAVSFTATSDEERKEIWDSIHDNNRSVWSNIDDLNARFDREIEKLNETINRNMEITEDSLDRAVEKLHDRMSDDYGSLSNEIRFIEKDSSHKCCDVKNKCKP